jgi:methyl acetate hydrolase
MKTDLDALLGQAAASGDVPGVVAMVTDGKDTLYSGAFGLRALGQPAAMSLDTVGWIASMTKALTSTAAAQLLEQGKLSLDEPASRWLPELGRVQVLEGFGADGKPRLRAPKTPLTLRHLITHTSGFGYEFLSHDIQKYQAATQTPSMFTGLPASMDLPLLFDPGERWQYGIGLDWVGRIVEAVSGKRLGAYLAEHVLAPLGMKETAFALTPAMRERLAKIHLRGPDGKLAPLDLEVPQPPPMDMGGGGLYGTVGDYLKFVRMILNRGQGEHGRVLKAETVEQMCRNQMGGLEVQPIKTANPMFTNDLPMPPGIPHRWGLAFMINEKPLPTGRSAGSLMWAGLSNCYYWIDPSAGVAGVIMHQVLPFADVKALPLFLGFEMSVYRNLKKAA